MTRTTAPMPRQLPEPPPEPTVHLCDHPGCREPYHFGFSIPPGAPVRRFCAAHRGEGEMLVGVGR